MPLPIQADHHAFPIVFEGKILALGLTKREYLAAIALQGLLAQGGGREHKRTAENAVALADALIEASKE